MTYILYGSRRSGSLAVELALAEIGADYQIQEVDLDEFAQRDDAYAAVNPQQKIPALITPTGTTPLRGRRRRRGVLLNICGPLIVLST